MANRVINTVLQLRDNMSGGFLRAARNAKKAGADISQDMINSTRSVIAFKNKSVRAMKDFASGTAKAAAASASALSAAFLAMDGATEEYRIAQGRVNTAFESAGLSSEAAKKSYNEFYKILGETDTAAEASQLLAKLTKSEKDISTWTKISAGVMGTFGDSLPVEGLIEAANETARVGQVTGPLADALNWVSISEDEFNNKLAACSSEAERNKLIMDTLSKQYDGAANAFYKNNEQLTKSRAYQNQLSASMSVLGNASLTAKNKILEMLGAQEDGIRAGSVFDMLSKKAQQFSDWINTVDLSSFAPKVEAGVSAAFEKASSAISWFKQNSDSLVTALKVLSAAFVGVKTLKFSADMINTMSTIKGFISTVNVLTVAKRAEAAEWVKSAALKAKDTAATIAHKTASIASTVATKGLTAGLIAHKVATVASAAVTKTLTISQTALNLAMSANPIGLVVIAIAALVAAGVLLYKNWDKVKAKAIELWDKVKSVFSGIRDSIVNAFTAAKEKVKDVIEWIDDKISKIPILGNLYSGSKSAVNWAVNLVTGHNALGTSYWKGGLTSINERGGEIVNLPSGAKVIPHDISVKIADSFAKGLFAKNLGVDYRRDSLISVAKQSPVISNTTNIFQAQDRSSDILTAIKNIPSVSNVTNVKNITNNSLAAPVKKGTAVPNITNIKNITNNTRYMDRNIDISGIIKEISALKSVTKNDVSSVTIGSNSLGTDYWKGGPTKVNERGGEIMNLPSGTKIIPHDVSKKAAGSPSINVNVTIQGNVIGNKAYANEVGEVIVEKILRAIENS